MIRLRKQLVLIVVIALAVLTACASHPRVKGHLTSVEVQDLMDRNAVQKFDVSRAGGAVIVLDSGEIFTADFPPNEKIRQYLERRNAIRKPATFVIE